MKLGPGIITVALAVSLCGCTGAELVAGSFITALGAHAIGDSKQSSYSPPKQSAPAPRLSQSLASLNTSQTSNSVFVKPKPAPKVQEQKPSVPKKEQEIVQKKNTHLHSFYLVLGLSHYEKGEYRKAFQEFRKIEIEDLSQQEKEKFYLYTLVSLKLADLEYLVSSYVEEAKVESVDLLNSPYMNDFHPAHRLWIQSIFQS